MIASGVFFGFVGLLAGIGGGATLTWLISATAEQKQPPPKDEFKWKYLVLWLFAWLMIVAWFAAFVFLDQYRATIAFMGASVVGLGLGLNTARTLRAFR